MEDLLLLVLRLAIMASLLRVFGYRWRFISPTVLFCLGIELTGLGLWSPAMPGLALLAMAAGVLGVVAIPGSPRRS